MADLLFKSSELFDAPPTIGLYSDGLDSAAGLTRQLATQGERGVLPVTVCQACSLQWLRLGISRRSTGASCLVGDQ